MFGNRLIKSNNAGAACTTDTVQILDGTPLESIATYQLNGAATSIPNNTYPGTFTNPAYAAGEFGQAAEFNGSSSSVSVTTTSSTPINFSLRNYSLSLWVNTTSTTLGALLSKYGDTDATRAFTLQARADGTIRHYERATGTFTQTDSTATVNDGSWHHVVVTKSSTQTIVYVDNVATINNNTFTSNNGGTEPFRIGRDNTGSPEWFNGLIDQVRIFNTALSAGAVTSLYNETVATASNSYINVPSCVVYYKMSDATDETGSYDGTPTNVNFNVAGKFGNAGDFNGSSSKIQLPQTYGAEGETFSYSFWINTTTNGTGLTSDEYIISKRNGSNTFHINITDSGKLMVNDWRGTPVVRVQSTTTVTDGTWRHIVFTYNNTVGRVYINGVQETSMDFTGDLATQSISNGNTIGLFDAGGRAYTGKLDQVRIFNRAITANEVTTLYNEVECIPTIVPTDYFNTVLYTGNGGTQSITSLDFQPDLVWLKSRETTRNHILSTSVQQQYNYLSANLTNAEATSSARITSLDSNGFTVGSSANVNENNTDYVAWNWKAADTTTTIAANTVGNTIASDVRANTDAGFSIVSYTGNSTAGATVGHGLSSAPEMVIVKKTSVSGTNWAVYHTGMTNATQYMWLNLANAQATGTNIWNSTAPTSTVFSIGTSSNTNTNNDAYIAYCFHSVDGFSKMGSYTGTGTTLQSIVTGFRPRFVLIKNTTDGNVWTIGDSVRSPNNPVDKALFPNLANAEYTYPGTPNGISFVSNGFTLNTNQPEFNQSSGGNNNPGTYIFMAFAEEVYDPNGVTRDATDPFGDGSETGLFKLNNTLTNEETGNNGTIAQHTSFVTAKFGEGLRLLDVSGDGIGNVSKFDTGITLSATTMSVSFWFKRVDNLDRTFPVWADDNRTPNSSQGHNLHYSNKTITVTNRRQGYGTTYTVSHTLTFDDSLVYTHICYVYDHSATPKMNLYINGVSESTNTGGHGYAGPLNLQFGISSIVDNQLPRNFIADQVRVFDRALDSGEVTQLYNE